LGDALKDTRRLALALDERYCPRDDDLLVLFSGSKGFHLGLPTCLWGLDPSPQFHQTARHFAQRVAERAGVATDAGVYDKVRAFRAPNSRHPKTGLHKRRFTLDELTGLSLERIVELSREPAPFDLPEPSGTSDTAAADWQEAADQVAAETEAKTARRASGAAPTLNRSTLDFIRQGADQGDRHRLLFSAAANLAEFGCPPPLAVALLEESALDCGLPPSDWTALGQSANRRKPPQAILGALRGNLAGKRQGRPIRHGRAICKPTWLGCGDRRHRPRRNVARLNPRRRSPLVRPRSTCKAQRPCYRRTRHR
jgi:hypothetical protein